jgi:hypothetical protein
MKWKLLLITALLAAQLATACKDVYYTNENVTITDYVLAAYEGADCNISIYNTTAFFQNGSMVRSGTVYSYSAGYLSKGIYGGAISCNLTGTNLTGECKFEVKPGDNTMLAIIILLPLIIAFLLLYGAVNMGEDHTAIKITAFLFTPILFIASLHAALLTLVEVYGFTEMQNFIGSVSYWFIWVTIVLFIYFFIYIFYKLVKKAAQDKETRLNY